MFLDELSEFARSTLDALRQPLEDGRIALVRARHSAVYPARFMLLAATNPCPCGYAGDGDNCRCSEAEHARHRRRLSGPLLDRIDLCVNMQRDSAHSLESTPFTTSDAARERVVEARERQAARLRKDDAQVNAMMGPGELARHARLDSRAGALLARAQASGMLSARGHHRVQRVARTIADLRRAERISVGDLAQALGHRPETDLAGSRVA